MTATGPGVLTGIDLPVGSPGGSVELLRDLYLGSDPLIHADVFMLPGQGVTPTGQPPGPGGPVLLDVPGKTLEDPGFRAYTDALARALRSRFGGGGHELLHLQHLAFGATPALARAFPELPRIALLHGTDLLFAADHPTQHAVLDETVTGSDVLVTPTAAMVDQLHLITRARPRQVVHIPWGIPDRLLDTPPVRPPRPDGPLRVLYAGRLTPEKGGTELFTQLGLLPGTELSVAAPPGEYVRLSSRLDPECSTRLRPLGWLDRAALWRAFAEHDLLVVPSNRLEAFGLVAVEAQACGLPVLYREVPGLVEVLGDSAIRYGGDEPRRALPALVAELRDDPAALEQLRRAGLANAARYPLSGTAKALRSLSEDVQRGRNRRAAPAPLLAMRGLFRGPSDLVDPELYARVGRGSAGLERTRLRLEPGTEVSGNTYFGRFPASYWQRWTRAEEVTVRLTATGSGQLLLRASDSLGGDRTVASRTLREATATGITLTVRLDRFLDGGALWLDAATGPDQVLRLEEIRWTVPAPARPRRTAVTICTMNRADDCLGNLEALAGDPDALAVLDTVYVVDQGSDLVRDRAGFAAADSALGGRLRCLTQPNLGGAGGFSRGLYEATGPAPGRPTPPDVLFMDDDVLLEPDLLVRMTAFAASTAEPLILGGQMLNLLHPARLHAGAEYTDLDRARPGALMPHSLHDAELLTADPDTGLTPHQELRLDAGYNGWWACLIPAEVTAAIGYPLPLFFQGDDAEYSYRARAHGFPTLTLPGAGLWHTDFAWKDHDEVNRYFIVRNYTIISALHGRFPLPLLLRTLVAELVPYLMSMQYGAAATVISAVEDFLAGPDTLADGGTETLGRLRRMRAGYPETRRHRAADVPGLPSNAIVIADPEPGRGGGVDRPGLRDLALLRGLFTPLLGAVSPPGGRAARLRQVTGLPRNGAQGPGGRVYPALRHAEAHWWHVAPLGTALVTDASQEGFRLRRYDPVVQARLTRAAATVLWRLLREGPAVRGRYRAAAAALGSRRNWTRLFGLPAESPESPESPEGDR